MHPPFSPIHLVPLIRFVDRVLRSSVRFSVRDQENLIERVRDGEPAVFVCQHGQLWPVLWSVLGTGTQVLVSHSTDGELLARLLRGWGFRVSRGSSSKAGFSGARGALRSLREGGCVGLAVDGPRGPRGEVQEGALRLARRAKVRLVPLRAEGSLWIWRRSWDHFGVPVPFASLRVEVGPAVEVGPGAEGITQATRRIESALAAPVDIASTEPVAASEPGR